MLKNPDYITARRLLLETISTVGTEKLALCESGGRILAQDLVAVENIPPFDRSPYDGYAFRAADTEKASRETPVTLCILEEVPTGAVPTVPVTEGTAVKLLTGAPIPTGADTVIPYELTDFTDTAVTVFAPAKPGDNVSPHRGRCSQGAASCPPGRCHRSGNRRNAGLTGHCRAGGLPDAKGWHSFYRQ